MNYQEILEDFNLQPTEDNIILLKHNIKHLKNQQELYRLSITYPNLYYFKREGLYPLPLILKPPPRNVEKILTIGDLHFDAVQYSFIGTSTNNFENFDFYNFTIHNFVAGWKDIVQHKVNHMHMTDGDLWYTKRNVSGLLSWSLRDYPDQLEQYKYLLG